MTPPSGQTTYSRSVVFRGAVSLYPDDVAAFARITEEACVLLRWSIQMSGREISGTDVDSLENALSKAERGDAVNSLTLLGAPGPYVARVTVVVDRRMGRIEIVGADLNWVAGTRDRFQDEVNRRLTVSFWWQAQGFPIAFLVALVAGGVVSATGLVAFVGKLFWVSVCATLGFLTWQVLTVISGPTFVLRKKGEPVTRWFQHPRVESAKTVALFIGALWALVQLVRLSLGW